MKYKAILKCYYMLWHYCLIQCDFMNINYVKICMTENIRNEAPMGIWQTTRVTVVDTKLTKVKISKGIISDYF